MHEYNLYVIHVCVYNGACNDIFTVHVLAIVHLLVGFIIGGFDGGVIQ